MATEPAPAKAGDGYCFLPLYVFSGDQLLVSYLRPSNIDGAKHAWAIRRHALAGTDMARAQAGTIRLRLLKVSAVVIRNTRRVSIHLSSACPDKALFHLVAQRLKPG